MNSSGGNVVLWVKGWEAAELSGFPNWTSPILSKWTLYRDVFQSAAVPWRQIHWSLISWFIWIDGVEKKAFFLHRMERRHRALITGCRTLITAFIKHIFYPLSPHTPPSAHKTSSCFSASNYLNDSIRGDMFYSAVSICSLNICLISDCKCQKNVNDIT